MVQLKDYYKVLELTPSADRDEIKKAYRRLAHQYHPDKNGENRYAITRFAAIKEAYETLMDPAKKEEYLQLRWYAQSTGKFTTEELLTPVTILQQMIALERSSASADIHRMDKLRLQTSLHTILSEEAIITLNEFNETTLNDEVINLAVSCCRLLTHALALPILKKLERIQASVKSYDFIKRSSASISRAENWEKKQLLFVLLAVVILCLIIWLSNR